MRYAVSATEARVRFGELMRRVTERGEIVVVERGGQPQVVVLSVDEYERLSAGRREDWKELARRAREGIRDELNGRELPPPEEVIRQGREDRDERLLGLR